MSQITLRNLPKSVEDAIRNRAREKDISLNQSATELLQQAVGGATDSPMRRNVRDLAGTWSDEEADAFDRVTEELRTLDPEVWR